MAKTGLVNLRRYGGKKTKLSINPVLFRSKGGGVHIQPRLTIAKIKIGPRAHAFLKHTVLPLSRDAAHSLFGPKTGKKGTRGNSAKGNMRGPSNYPNGYNPNQPRDNSGRFA